MKKTYLLGMCFVGIVASASLATARGNDHSVIKGKVVQDEKIEDVSNTSMAILGKAEANAGSISVDHSTVDTTGSVQNTTGTAGSLHDVNNTAVDLAGDAVANDASVTVKDTKVSGKVLNETSEKNDNNTAIGIMGDAKANSDSITMKNTTIAETGQVVDRTNSSDSSDTAISLVGQAKANEGSITVE